MKLFISNKSDMDYQLQSEAKEAHKLAYNELLRNLTVENSIPISLLVSKGRIDYLFSLDKVDVEKDLYIYNFRGSVLD